MKLSARNQFKGKIVSVDEGVITAKVKVEVKTPITVTAVITKDAVEELGLKSWGRSGGNREINRSHDRQILLFYLPRSGMLRVRRRLCFYG